MPGHTGWPGHAHARPPSPNIGFEHTRFICFFSPTGRRHAGHKKKSGPSKRCLKPQSSSSLDADSKFFTLFGLAHPICMKSAVLCVLVLGTFYHTDCYHGFLFHAGSHTLTIFDSMRSGIPLMSCAFSYQSTREPFSPSLHPPFSFSSSNTRPLASSRSKTHVPSLLSLPLLSSSRRARDRIGCE